MARISKEEQIRRARGVQIVREEMARLKAWLTFFRDKPPERYRDKFFFLALNTTTWPNEVRECMACGFPTPIGHPICKHCEAEEEGYRDELREYAAVNRGY